MMQSEQFVLRVKKKGIDTLKSKGPTHSPMAIFCFG